MKFNKKFADDSIKQIEIADEDIVTQYDKYYDLFLAKHYEELHKKEFKNYLKNIGGYLESEAEAIWGKYYSLENLLESFDSIMLKKEDKDITSN